MGPTLIMIVMLLLHHVCQADVHGDRTQPPTDITPHRSESPVQWQGRIKPTESHIADLKAKFQEYGGRKPPGHHPLSQNPCQCMARPDETPGHNNT